MSSDKTQTPQEHPFARFVRILGKGKSGSRSLSQQEASEAFGMILRDEVEPVQIGAFLMLLRVKEETAEELAGFVQACRETMHSPPQELHADLDWSCYAGKKNQPPWFILSLLLLADAGHRILIHGSAGHTAGRLYTEYALQELGLPVANSWQDVDNQLNNSNLSYLPLQVFCPALHNLMQLRPLLGLRSPVNTLARLLNPLQAGASIQSVFHPAYADLHQQADRLLGQPRALVFKGESGEIEIKPHADTRLHLLQQQETGVQTIPRSMTDKIESVAGAQAEALRALWAGHTDDRYGVEATVSTTAVAMMALTPGLDFASALPQAQALWHHRDSARLS